MALTINELNIVNCEHHKCKKRVYIESAMPSATLHLTLSNRDISDS